MTSKPTPAAKQTTVWVLLKSQANAIAAGKASKDWKGKGTGRLQRPDHERVQLAGEPKNVPQRQSGAKFKPFWIVNTVKVTADQQTIDEIAKRSDVAKVVPDKTFSLPPLQPNTAGINALEWNLENIHAPEVWDRLVTGATGSWWRTSTPASSSITPPCSPVPRQQGDGTFDHNYNWFDPANVCGSPSTVPCDNVFHGTHTMGTMVGDDGRQPDRRRARRPLDRGQGL